MICLALGEGAVTDIYIKRLKSGFRHFAMVVLTSPTEKDLVSRKNSKM